MNIGKQSTLNDLADLRKDFEGLNIDLSSKAGAGVVASGSIFDYREKGIYTVTRDVTGVSGLAQSDKAAVCLADGVGYNVSLVADFSGGAAIAYKSLSNESIVRLLTSLNTITDANGFIKAA